MSRGVLLSALIGGAVFLSGCGTLDPESIEGQIADEIEQQAEVTDVTVDCPEGIAPEKGGVFECTASGGMEAPIKVTQTDDKGGIDWFIDTNVLGGPVETEIATGIDEQTGSDGATVDCPATPVEPGSAIDCEVGGGSDGTVTVTVGDDKGITWELTGAGK